MINKNVTFDKKTLNNALFLQKNIEIIDKL